jgi:hypothetical protein
MTENMELGLVVHGGDVPRRIAAHFNALITSGDLQPAALRPGSRTASR